MADDNNSGNTNANGNTNQNSSGGQGNSVMAHMMEHKIETTLWLTRIFTVVCSVLFILPIFGGNPYSFYQRALISAAATSALRMHQRLPNIQLNMDFLRRLFAEDSSHYLMYCIIFINSYPMTMSLIPVFLFALLHACSFTKVVLNLHLGFLISSQMGAFTAVFHTSSLVILFSHFNLRICFRQLFTNVYIFFSYVLSGIILMGPQSMMFVRNMIVKLETQQVNILRFIASTEIFLMPAVIILIFTGKSSFFLPFVYYRFLTLRYTSRRNPYCRILFTEFRQATEYLCSKPQCPQFVRSICFRSIAFISRLAPQAQAQ